MNEQGSYDGFSPAAYGAPSPANPGPPAGPPAQFAPAAALRPLSTGEVLDRTFVLYRRRFWLFAGIGMVPAGLLTLISMLRLIFVKASQLPVAGQPGVPTDALAKAMSKALLMQAYFLPATLLFVLVYGISNAATVHAVMQITTGLATSAVSAYQAVRGRWLRWTGIALRQFWSAFWPVLPSFAIVAGTLVFLLPQARGGAVGVGLLLLLAFVLGSAGLVFGVINLLRLMLAMPASVQEGLGINAAVRRSRVLVAGRKGRIFLLLLLVYVLQIVAGSVQLPLVFIALRAHGAQQVLLETIELLITFVATTVVGPVLSIALCLFYIDERVRREGYDIELLMQRSFAVTDAAAIPAEAQPLA